MAPIDAERCVSGRELLEPRLVRGGGAVVYVRAEEGVAVLVVQPLDGSPTHTLGDVPGVRAGRGMGGGAWCFAVDGRAVVHVGGDANLWRQPLEGGPSQRLTDHGPELAASSPAESPDGRLVAYTVDGAEVHVVEPATGHHRRVDDGADEFVLDPSWGDDGGLRWVAWRVPDMPWDHTVVRTWFPDGRRAVADRPGATHQVRGPWSVRDEHGFMNVCLDDWPLVAEPFEHAGPAWGPGLRSYAPSPDGARVAFTRNEAGFGRLCVADVATRSVREVARGVHGQLSWEGRRLAALRTGARTPTQVVVYDTDTWEREVVAVGPQGEWGDDDLAEPELVQIPAQGGAVHARLFRAEGDPQRVIVWLHGGPTDQWQVTWMPRIAYWRSRGWHVLVPDHRGSSGHGRAYQQALRGRWGELDVADTVAAVGWAHTHGLAQPAGTVVMGSSAGGFTVLCTIAAAPGACAAGVALYPVTDLLDMAERSHRFERHYTDTLIGPLPQAEGVMRQRSPLNFADRLAGTPLLVLHGDLDPVVPVDQSRVLAERVRGAGGHLQLHVYQGEGHGVRQRVNQLDEFHRVGEFLARWVRVASAP